MYLRTLEILFLTALELAWKTVLKQTKQKLDILTDIDLLLIVEKGVGEEICHAIYQYAKANDKYMKNFDKNKES